MVLGKHSHFVNGRLGVRLCGEGTPDHHKLQQLLLQTEKFGGSASNVDKFKSENENLTKQLKRLKTIAEEQIKEMRNVCWALLGWRFDMDFREHRYTLTSKFSEKGNCLIFKQADKGSFQMLETPFATSLSEETFVYLHKCNSIPAFLANLQLDLFNSKTFKY